ncbi:hypothetical protein L1I79_33755 [Strepomyces sp. STD 3.1]|nr:hypothetical protein [Streptomyces sp. STD 3.1]
MNRFWRQRSAYPLSTGMAYLTSVMRWALGILATLNLILFVVAAVRTPRTWELWLFGYNTLTVGALTWINITVYRRHQAALVTGPGPKHHRP